MILFTDQDIQDAYDLYVTQYYSTETGPITLEYFYENVWLEWDDLKRMDMIHLSRQTKRKNSQE